MVRRRSRSRARSASSAPVNAGASSSFTASRAPPLARRVGFGRAPPRIDGAATTLHVDLRAEAVVATVAFVAGRGVAEVAQRVAAAAAFRVSILLHRVELLQICFPATVDQVPVDWKAGERTPRRREPCAATEPLPLHELARLQRVEELHCTHAADARRQSVEVDRDAVIDRRARDSPQRPQQAELHCVVRRSEIALDAVRRCEQAHEHTCPRLTLDAIRPALRENAQRRLDVAAADLRFTFRRDVVRRKVDHAARVGVALKNLVDLFDERSLRVRALDEEFVREPIGKGVQ